MIVNSNLLVRILIFCTNYSKYNFLAIAPSFLSATDKSESIADYSKEGASSVVLNFVLHTPRIKATA